jgi:hypothetical protein
VAWPVAALAVVAVAVGVLAATGSDPEHADVPIDCAVYDVDNGVRFSLRGLGTEAEAEGGCAELAADLSGSGSYWKVGAPALPNSEPELVCALSDPEGGVNTALVEVPSDSFFTQTATGICGELVSEGWTEVAGQVTGPWQEEWMSAVRDEEAFEAEEQFHEEQRNAAIERCEQRAAAVEEAELRRIESEAEERVKAAPSESAEYAAEEEGWEREEEAWERGEEAREACAGG